MNKWIRWPGLIAFVIISGLISAITLLFLDTWIRIAVEKGLAQQTGAEVNLGSVSHTLSPFGVNLYDLQVTDARQPKNNQVQADEVSAIVEVWPLLMHKVIVDEMVVDGIQFGVTRAKPGQVYRQPDEQTDGSFALPFDAQEAVPDVDELLANSPLKTTKAIEEAEAAYAKSKQDLTQQYQALPSKAKLDEYKTRVKALTETDFKNPVELAKAKEEFDALKAELNQDKQALQTFKESVTTAKDELAPKLAQLKAAPGQDYDLMKGLVAGDAAAIEEVTQALFGPQVSKWSQYLLSAYQVVAPMAGADSGEQVEQPAASGRWISFDDTSQLPDVLVRKAKVSLKWQDEVIASDWTDITHQHDIIGKPTLFKIDSTASSLWQSLLINGDFWVKEAGINAKQNWDLKGLVLDNLEMIDQRKLSSQLIEGLLSSAGQLSVENNALDGKGVINLGNLNIDATGSNHLTNVIADALNNLNSLSIESILGGMISAPDFDFNSNLDQQLKSALLSNLSGEDQSKLNELKQKLNAKAAGALGTGEGNMSQLLDWQQLADGNIGSIDDMLSSKLNSVVDQQKQKLEDKLKEKLGKKLFGG